MQTVMTSARMSSNAATSNSSFGASDAEASRESIARVEAADKLVRKFVLLSIGAGAIPFPIFDIAASVVLQLKLIQELSDLYGVDYRDDLARNAIGTCMTTSAGLMIGSRLGSSLSKFFPGAGTKFGIIRTATFFGASTHISGKILIMHFEAGGSLLNLDAVAMRKHYEREFESSQKAVQKIRDEQVAKWTTPTEA
jgi:uncharacterized protein (DUF697 family)